MARFSLLVLWTNLKAEVEGSRILNGLVATSFAIGIGGLVPVLTGSADPAFCWLTVAAMVLGAVCWLLSKAMPRPRLHARPSIEPLNDAPSRRRHAKRAMLATVSLYRSFKTDEFPAPVTDWEALAADRDWRALHLDHPKATNMGPLLAGIEANSPALQHLWLIATTDSSRRTPAGRPVAPGSAAIIPALTAFLTARYPKLEVHAGADYRLSMDSHEHIGDATYQLVHEILHDAEAHGIAPDDFVVDVTGGNLTMSVAAVLANLDLDRDIQVIFTEYNSAHETQELTPIHVSFEPVQSVAAVRPKPVP